MPRFYYKILGQIVVSSQFIPFVQDLYDIADKDVQGQIQFHIDAHPAPEHISYPCVYSSYVTDPDQRQSLFSIYEDEGAYHVIYFRFVRFVIAKKGININVYTETDDYSKEISVLLLGPVFALVAELNGILCFHASAVRSGNNAIMLVGNKGAGKTTLTTALIGHDDIELVGDDTVPLASSEYGIQAVPTHSQLRLWTDSADFMFAGEKFPEVHLASNKLSISMQRKLTTENSNLVGIYFLNRETDIKQVADWSGEKELPKLSTKELYIRLVKCSLISSIVSKLGLQKTRLQTIATISQTVPGFEFQYPSDLKQLADVSTFLKDRI